MAEVCPCRSRTVGVILDQAAVYNNSASYKTGGGVYLPGSVVLVVYSGKLFETTAHQRGGALASMGEPGQLLSHKCICCHEQQRPEQGVGLYLSPGTRAVADGGSKVVATHKDVEGAFVGAEDTKHLPTLIELRFTGKMTRFIYNTVVNGGALNVYAVRENNINCKLSVHNGIAIKHNSASEVGGGLVSNAGCSIDHQVHMLFSASADSTVKAGGAISDLP